MFIGVLPGIGPIATVGMLLPITFHLRPTEALIMLAGIYYGAMYGGSITSILLRLPGDASSAVTVVEGYPMAQQGRAGTALVMTTVASFFGACVAIVLVATLAPPLARLALQLPVAGIFLAHAGRADRRLRAGARLVAEGPGDGGARPDHRHGRPGPRHRVPPLHLRLRRALRRRQFRRRWWWRCSGWPRSSTTPASAQSV